MNTPKLCYYTVARFVQDLIKDEPRNIGVLLFDEEGVHYETRFINNIRQKFGASISIDDKEVLTYYFKYFDDLTPSTKDDLIELTKNMNGKLQFSDIKTVVTENVEAEMNYLFRTFVDNSKASKVQRHRLKTSLKQEFKKLNILGDNKLQSNQEIKSGKIPHIVDFSYQNGKLYTIEAVDLSLTNRRSNVIETAFKFEDLRHSLGSKKVETISVVNKAGSDNDDSKELLYILNSFSSVYDFSNDQREAFLNRMAKVVK